VDFLNDPSKRRLLVTLITTALASLAPKLGITQDTVELLVGLAIAYVTGGNIKEALVRRAEAAGKAAAEGVTPETARKVLLDAIASEKAKAETEAKP
jgi:ribosomal protein L12E/L44/L45/RPP1/RPP2